MIEEPQVELQEEKPIQPTKFVCVHRRAPQVGDPQRMFKATYPGFRGPQVLVPTMYLDFGAAAVGAAPEVLTHWSVANEAGIIEHVGLLLKAVRVSVNDRVYLDTIRIINLTQHS